MPSVELLCCQALGTRVMEVFPRWDTDVKD